MRRLALTIAVGFGLAACAGGSGEKKETRTAADEAAPAPPSDEKIQEAKEKKEKQEEQKAAQAEEVPQAQKKKIAASERADFDAQVAKWQEAKKAGPITREAAKSMAAKFSSLASQHPTIAAQAHFNAGTLQEFAGDQKGAEGEYNEALQANPAYGPALNNLGEIYYRTGSPQRAREWFEKAIKVDPTGSASAYANLGLMLYQDGNYKDAVAQLRRALAIDNDSMAAYALLALVYYTTAEGDRAKLSLAELVCKQAKETNDKYAPIYNTLGLIQLKKKNVTGALKEFEHAVQLDPNYVEAHLNIGAIGLSTRQYDKAEAAFQVVLRLKPDNVDAVIGLGVAQRGLKKYDEAEAQYKKALQLDGKNCAVPYDLGVLYQDYKPAADNSNLKQAQEFYRQYVSCSKTTPKKVEDANRRIKDIDDTFAALEQQKKMEAELKVQQAEMEKQQAEMEKQQKAQEEAAKAQQKPEEKKEEKK